MEPIRLLIADDHQMVRDGLRRLLEREPDLAVVGESAGVSDTLVELHRLLPDVLLLDLQLADGSGRDVLAALPQIPCSLRAIAITGHLQEGSAEELIGLGASGYLLKSASAGELVCAIRAVHRGEIWADHGTLSRLVEQLRTSSIDRFGPAAARTATPDLRDLSRGQRGVVAGKREGASGLLSAREREILQSVGQGYNNNEIAARLFISENTVKAHLSRIFQKLMVADRTQAVVIGLQRGLITATES
jgi:two-component system, NarL family, response regulator DegU